MELSEFIKRCECRDEYKHSDGTCSRCYGSEVVLVTALDNDDAELFRSAVQNIVLEMAFHGNIKATNW